MNADTKQLELDVVTSQIIACAYRVSNALGAGFLEKVYENAMAVEFRDARIRFEQQPNYLVRYKQEVVGDYVPDFVVAESVVVEIKALDLMTRVHQAQCMNYLRATGLSVGLLLNFGAPRLELKRVVWRF
jgi:GxxExxY protein